MRIEEYSVASQILKEHGVPGLHRPVGEEHIDFTRGIKVMRVRIDDGGKDGEQIHITWAIVERRVALHAGQQNRRVSPQVRYQHAA